MAEQEAEQEAELVGLRHSEARFRALVERAQDIIAVIGVEDGLIHYVSPSVATVVGFAPEEVLGQSLTRHLHPDDLPLVGAAFVDAAAGGTARATVRSLTQDGSTVHLEITLSALAEEGGEIREIMAAARDVTERITSAQALAHAHAAVAGLSEQMETAQRITGIGSWSVDAADGSVAWSEQTLRLFGCDPLAGGPCPADLAVGLSRQDRKLSEQVIPQALRTGEPFFQEYPFRRLDDGQVRILRSHGTPERDGTGAVVRLTGTIEDVTDRRRTEQALADAQDEMAEQGALMAQAQRIARIGSWSGDLVTRETIWSDQLYRLLGTDRDGCPPSITGYLDFLHPDDRTEQEAIMAELRRSGVPFHFRHRLVRPDGSALTVESHGEAERDARGRIVRVMGTVQDVTEAQELDRRLAQAHDALAQQSRLMARAEHAAGIGSWSVRLETDQLVWSQQMRRIFGAADDLAPISTQRYLDFVVPEDHDAVRAAMAQTMQTGEPCLVEHRIVSGDGQQRVIRVTSRAERDEAGRIVQLTGTGEDVTDARETERQLSHTRDQLTELLGAGTEQAIMANDLAGNITLFNKGAERMLGYTAEEMIGTHGYERFQDPAEWAARVLREGSDGDDDDVLRRGDDLEPGADDHEWTYVRRDGRALRVQLLVSRMHDADGNVTGHLGVATDVTERRRFEREITEARDVLHRMLSAATEQAIMGTTLDGVVNHFNRGAERMLGYTAEEMLGMRGFSRFHDTAEVEARMASLIERGVGVRHIGQVFVEASRSDDERDREWTYVRKDGGRLTVSLFVTPIEDADGTVTGFMGIATDITARRAAERERDEHAQMLRAVIENNQSIIYVKDLTGRYLLVNQAYQEAHGVTEEEVLGSTDEGRNPGLAAMWHENNMKAVDGAYTMQEYADLADGRHEYQAVKLPLFDADGRVYAICGLSLDITERRRAERDVAMAVEAMSNARDEALAANAAKSAFLATMSHEIRTPMNAVIGLTGLLLDSPLDTEQRDLLQTVRSSGDLLLAIINDILDFSKIDAGDLELEHRPFDLRDLVEGTMAQFAGSAHGLDLIVEMDDDCPEWVIGDVTRLRQVLANLVGNALKFTHDGEVVLRVGQGPAAGVDGTGGEEGMLRFDVRDTGIGIPAASMDRLFKSFSQVDASTTRTYGGTGLGLAISRALVLAMEGELWVTSQPGTGSTFSFTVRLPADPGPEPVVTGRPDPAVLRARLTGRRVLIVDGNETYRRVLGLQLAGQGMIPTGTASPAEALQLLARRTAVDVVLLGRGGSAPDDVEATAAMLRAGLPLVLLSGTGRRAEQTDGVYAAVLTRPVRRAVLLETLARAISPGTVPVQRAAPPEASPEGTARLRILLVEDNEVNQKVGRLMLGKLGHTVEIAAEGESALAAAHAADYDVILMDMHMPVMDGLESTRRIRAELPAGRQPLIIAMTAGVTLEDREACAAAGMNAYLPKPVRAAELAAALADVIPRALGALQQPI